MQNKADYLKECLTDPALVTGPVPLDVFTKEVCLLCMNRSCVRAGTNNMAFDRRAANWKHDLFDAVPRAQENDPNFATIRQKKFLSVVPGAAVPGSPNFVTVGPSQAQAAHFIKDEPEPEPEPEKETVREQVPVPVPVPVPDPPKQETVVTQAAPVQEPTSHVSVGLENTPFQQGTVIAGGTPAPKDVVVKPGATFTFGDDDEG